MKKHPVLLVDDDALIINMLTKKFSSRDIEFYTATSPEEARNVLNKIVPELVILDLLLTKEDGSAGVLDKLKSEERLAHVPVMILTNLDKPELKQMLISQGVKEYIIKGSLSLDELHKKVLGYLQPKIENE